MTSDATAKSYEFSLQFALANIFLCVLGTGFGTPLVPLENKMTHTSSWFTVTGVWFNAFEDELSKRHLKARTFGFAND